VRGDPHARNELRRTNEEAGIAFVQLRCGIWVVGCVSANAPFVVVAWAHISGYSTDICIYAIRGRGLRHESSFEFEDRHGVRRESAIDCSCKGAGSPFSTAICIIPSNCNLNTKLKVSVEVFAMDLCIAIAIPFSATHEFRIILLTGIACIHCATTRIPVAKRTKHCLIPDRCLPMSWSGRRNSRKHMPYPLPRSGK
jgi:hypothetical protein